MSPRQTFDSGYEFKVENDARLKSKESNKFFRLKPRVETRRPIKIAKTL